MPCSKPSQSMSNLSLIKNQIPWIILLSYFDSMKNIHNMLICYRLQTCCNIKIYIYCNFGSSYYIFLFEDYLFNSTPLSWEKKRCIFFIFIFWLQRFIYVYVTFFSTMQRRPRGVPFQILLRVVLFGALTSRDSYNCFCRWSWLGWWDFKIIGAAPIIFWLVILVKNYYSM